VAADIAISLAAQGCGKADSKARRQFKNSNISSQSCSREDEAKNGSIRNSSFELQQRLAKGFKKTKVASETTATDGPESKAWQRFCWYQLQHGIRRQKLSVPAQQFAKLYCGFASAHHLVRVLTRASLLFPINHSKSIDHKPVAYRDLLQDWKRWCVRWQMLCIFRI
jgi:hypothetical protein